MLNNIVDKVEQCGQHNIVQCCFHHARTDCSFFAVVVRVPAVHCTLCVSIMTANNV